MKCLLSKKRSMLYASGAFFVFLAVMGGFALTSFTYNQVLNVPVKEIMVYQSDGVTLLPDGQNLSSLWVWNSVYSSFELVVKVKNTGDLEVVTDVFSGDVPSGWSFYSSGEGALAVGGVQSVTLTLNQTGSSMTTGDWHWTVGV